MPVPLSILDLAPLVSGGDVRDALRRTLDLARRAEQFGYHRYWVAEHHFTPGVASSQPALLLGQIAAVTDHIRLGSGAVQTGFQTGLSIVEQFGLLDALYPGRFDLGLGRSGPGKKEAARLVAEEKKQQAPPQERVVDGLLIPKPFSWAPIFASKRTELAGSFLTQPGAEPLGLNDVLDQIQALLAGPVVDDEGNEVTATPGAGADLQVWLLGSSGGESARTAGARGLPFAANYHVAPAKVLEAVEAYRESFVPSPALAEPYVMVSADVLVAEDDATARHLAKPFAVWVRSIRTGLGAVPFPSIEEAEAFPWTDQDRAIVADRVDTQFAGSPQTVAERLQTLQRVTGADELLVTTITHDHADRVRSFELLAKEWSA
ncbi:putative monooxygenase (luciferase-like) [Actinoplanes philippinensis]|uniref:Luciferase family oxidoreductase, group 1 n=1 Tax=Actinoplanes philippinensis TaxID=35752 RepID=A0A1I2H251_9ACTN|nr:LLM class flavin-dependent oxidoreductase [Actinoplanes philippinensis]GIE78268.1 putative monooxygenase (luciferase-like) [Actinoplanes philippinensis]SFF23057.1 luciferase family oxidoreductase, group 1 [Actinoplanes philippinensis]